MLPSLEVLTVFFPFANAAFVTFRFAWAELSRGNAPHFRHGRFGRGFLTTGSSPPEASFNDNPRLGRLAANFFARSRPAKRHKLLAVETITGSRRLALKFAG
jgi:hypothetical protein